MSGDSENEVASAGKEPAPQEPAPNDPAGENSFRPFASWASAYESEPSMWTRMRHRIAGLFSRRDEKNEVALSDALDALDSLNEQNGERTAVVPRDDFKFPWTRPGEETPAPVVEDTFASVEDALPASDDLPPLADDDAPPAPPEPGFFSRLFGKREKEPVADALEADALEVEVLEVEVHEDRIEAAAQALDEASEAQFESFEGKSTQVGESFATVDDALPSQDALPLIYDFSPPATVPPATEVPLAVEPVAGDAAAEVRLVESPAAEPFDGVKAFEIDAPTEEIEDKTDEFEIVTIEDLEAGKDVNVETLEVDRKSFWTDSFIGRFFRFGDTEVEKVGATESEAAQASAVFLLAKFRAFYNEIIRFQHQKSEFMAGFATAVMATDSADEGPDAAAAGLSKRLWELLELQAAEAKWMGGEAGERYPDAQYAMAALADELFTYMEWEGQSAWPKYSLEHKVYKTHAAEVELFKRIDKLLKESSDSVVARDLARVYLLVLAAGFEGKWRPFGLTRPLAEYRQRLYEYIHGGDPLMLYAADRKVFPDAASRTLAGHAVSRFNSAQRWTAILIFLVVGYTLVAHIAWSRASADLKDVTTRIKSGSITGAP